MFSFDLTPQQIEGAIGAARAVASADGRFDDHERRLVEAAARALGYEGAVDAVPVASPERMRELLPDARARTRLVQALLLVALMDGEVVEAELRVLRAYAAALEVDEPRLQNMQQLMRGQTHLVKFDLWRRSEMLRGMVGKAWEAKGLRGVWQVFGGMKGLASDAETAWRYKQLGLLPEGTFGRAYWAHMTQRRYAFPGEVSGFPEEIVKHDLAHVIGGYDTDPTGECEVIAFISGFMKADPFSYLFQIFLHMQLGVEIFDGSPVEHLMIPADRVIAALERGSRVNADLYDPSWDYWADFPLPLAEVRAKYDVPS